MVFKPIFLCLLLLAAAGCGGSSSPTDSPPLEVGVTLNPGDLLVTDSFSRALFRVNPVTGNRDVVSGQVGGVPRQIAVDTDGTLLLALSEPSFPAILRVNPTDAVLSIVSATGSDIDPNVPFVGTGGRLQGPFGLARESTGHLLVGNRDAATIFRVDPATGDRTVISSIARGEGPPIFGPIRQIAVEPDGMLLVIVAFWDRNGAVYRIDPATGDRSVLSDDEHGAGNNLSDPRGIALSPDGDIFVSDPNQATIFQIDPETGDRKVLSGPLDGAGESPDNPYGLTFDAQERLLVADGTLIYHVDLDTGNRTVISAPQIGEGPAFTQAEDIVTFIGP